MKDVTFDGFADRAATWARPGGTSWPARASSAKAACATWSWTIPAPARWRRPRRVRSPSPLSPTRCEGVDYLADRGLATALYVALALGRPLLLEGEVGVGKTEVAKALADGLRTAA